MSKSIIILRNTTYNTKQAECTAIPKSCLNLFSCLATFQLHKQPMTRRNQSWHYVVNSMGTNVVLVRHSHTVIYKTQMVASSAKSSSLLVIGMGTRGPVSISVTWVPVRYPGTRIDSIPVWIFLKL